MPSDAKKKRAAAKKEAAKKKGQPKPKNDAANAAGDEVEANGVNGATNGDAAGQYQPLIRPKKKNSCLRFRSDFLF